MRPSSLHIVSWNVASWPTTVANICKMHGSLSNWLDRHKVDILCLQEVKATRQKMIVPPSGWKTFLSPCLTRPGLNGVATLVRSGFPTLGADIDPLQNDQLSGRCILTEHGAFTLINVYVPYDGENGCQLGLKVSFLTALQALVRKIQNSGRSVICVGDFNVARYPRDVHYQFRKLNLDLIGSNPELQKANTPEVQRVFQMIKTEWPQVRADLVNNRSVIEVGKKFALKVNGSQIGARQVTSTACTGIANPQLIAISKDNMLSSPGNMKEPIVYKEEGVLSVKDFFEIFAKLKNTYFTDQTQMAFSDLFGLPKSPPVVLALWDALALQDTYILANPAGRSIASERFTCWDQYKNERYENRGARIDYCLVDSKLVRAVRTCDDTNLKNNSLVTSPDREFALRAATANFAWEPVPFTGGGMANSSPTDFEFTFSNPPHTGIIYTPPVFSDHVATSLVLDMSKLVTEGIDKRAQDELGTQWKNSMPEALVSQSHSLKSMFSKKVDLKRSRDVDGSPLKVNNTDHVDLTSSPEIRKN